MVAHVGHMKSHGDEVKRIDFLCLVIALEIGKECLFVGEIPVVGQMVMQMQMIGPILYGSNLTSG